MLIKDLVVKNEEGDAVISKNIVIFLLIKEKQNHQILKTNQKVKIKFMKRLKSI